jgi:hypothetical protein
MQSTSQSEQQQTPFQRQQREAVHAQSTHLQYTAPALRLGASLSLEPPHLPSHLHRSFLVTKYTSPLTLQVLGNAKGVIAAIISILIFLNPVTVSGGEGRPQTVPLALNLLRLPSGPHPPPATLPFAPQAC